MVHSRQFEIIKFGPFYIFSLWVKNVAMWKKENVLKIFISSFAFLTRSVYFLGKLLPLLKKIVFSPNVRFFKEFFYTKIIWGKKFLTSAGEKIMFSPI